jgi:hypothetical protein
MIDFLIALNIITTSSPSCWPALGDWSTLIKSWCNYLLSYKIFGSPRYDDLNSWQRLTTPDNSWHSWPIRWTGPVGILSGYLSVQSVMPHCQDDRWLAGKDGIQTGLSFQIILGYSNLIIILYISYSLDSWRLWHGIDLHMHIVYTVSSSPPNETILASLYSNQETTYHFLRSDCSRPQYMQIISILVSSPPVPPPASFIEVHRVQRL